MQYVDVRIIKFMIRMLGLLSLVFLVKLLCFPFWFDILLVIGLIFFLSYTQLILFGGLVIILIATLNLVNPNPSGVQTFYREHEKYARSDVYQTNVNDLIMMPHGDLYAMGLPTSSERELIKEPRANRFITDEWGFRNAVGELIESNIILVGDSFIVGNGTSQEQSPAVVLGTILGKKVGSLAYPSEPEQYEKRIKEFLPKLSTKAKIFVFYFEGNDFNRMSGDYEYRPSSGLEYVKFKYFELEQFFDGFLKKIHNNDNAIFRRVRSLSHRINGYIFKFEEYGYVTYKEINGAMFGFYRAYVEKTKNSNELMAYIFKDEKVISRVNGIFFIPTKYRTYGKIMNLPLENNGGLEFLKNGYAKSGIPVFDLTGCLEDESQKLLLKNQFTFYRDDTHWNGNGIRAAMSCVSSSVKVNKSLTHGLANVKGAEAEDKN